MGIRTTRRRAIDRPIAIAPMAQAAAPFSTARTTAARRPAATIRLPLTSTTRTTSSRRRKRTAVHTGARLADFFISGKGRGSGETWAKDNQPKKQQQQPFEFEDMGFDGATAPGA